MCILDGSLKANLRSHNVFFLRRRIIIRMFAATSAGANVDKTYVVVSPL